jgi:hypothetical protein
MPLMGGLTAGLGSVFGGLAGLFGGGKQQKTQTSGTITNNQQGSFNQSTNPNLSPLQQSLISSFTKNASDLYNQSTNLQPYESSGLEAINQGSEAARRAMASNIASRGLSFSPAGATGQNQNTLSRIGQQTQFVNSLPLLQRQLQQQSLQQLMQAFQVIPTGQTSQGSTSQNSTQTQNGTNLVSGNPMGGLFSGLGAGVLGSLPGLMSNFQNPVASQQPGWTGTPAPPPPDPSSYNYGTGY